MVLAGLALGIAVAGVYSAMAGRVSERTTLYAWGSRFIEARLYGVSSLDPATLVTATLLILAAAVVAAWLPARHGGRPDDRHEEPVMASVGTASLVVSAEGS